MTWEPLSTCSTRKAIFSPWYSAAIINHFQAVITFGNHASWYRSSNYPASIGQSGMAVNNSASLRGSSPHVRYPLQYNMQGRSSFTALLHRHYWRRQIKPSPQSSRIAVWTDRLETPWTPDNSALGARPLAFRRLMDSARQVERFLWITILYNSNWAHAVYFLNFSTDISAPMNA